MVSAGEDAENGFTIEIALAPARMKDDGFSFVWVIHSGFDSDQLVMGQYRSSFIIMNGDDYDHSRRLKRITTNAASHPNQKRFVTITTSPKGTRIYIDGQLERKRKDLVLKIPAGDKVRLVLGNSVSGKNSWRGDIYGFGLYRYSLSEEEIVDHYHQWKKEQNFYVGEKNKLSLLYLFNEKAGAKAIDHSGNQQNLNIPASTKVLNQRFLNPPRNGLKLSLLDIDDIIVNFIGFMPFGFILSATLYKLGSGFRKHRVLLAVVICFAVSLTIEILQAWIPSRNSDLLDLVLNTIGGLIGAVIYQAVLAFTDDEYTTVYFDASG